MNEEHITHEANDEHAWICVCGNNPVSYGFYSCDEKGIEIEPIKGVWTGLYFCDRCGRIIDQKTLKVVGRKQIIGGEKIEDLPFTSSLTPSKLIPDHG